MKIQIISIGKLSKEIAALVDNYSKMSSWKLLYHELAHSQKNEVALIKADEASMITKKLRTDAYLIMLDATGKNLSSENFAKLLQEQMLHGKVVDFVIGGAFGLHESLIAKANLVLSLSLMTLPHQLAKLMLIEQIYRAETILNNHPYHK